ncbi:unnamed protein product [Aureobasidium pullulans]|nr:unnamed protein product [Aureobasidium pullulans]
MADAQVTLRTRKFIRNPCSPVSRWSCESLRPPTARAPTQPPPTASLSCHGNEEEEDHHTCTTFNIAPQCVKESVI